ncbi:hypothetical protein [Flammeovirga sp. SJP92]|uniref:hypothetical protein n=1 Tax=Flammeovirga sp. SJP92 TaxID=1775430 RepID=UPI000786BDE8|nr:hypothetical protein [Flammeovirga sp. SJP92]KXX70776.1 hypothetical protein AVL50_07150 [Flammeovirga sp. SJP92]
MNVYSLNSRIKIGRLLFESDVFTGIHKSVIRKSVDTFGNSATIEIPRNLSLEGKPVEDYLKRGDSVLIELGYNGDFHLEFEGYVSDLTLKYPIVIECEDESYHLKSKLANKSFSKASVGDIIEYIAPSYTKNYVITEDTQIGKFNIKNETGVDVAKRLNDYGIYLHFKDKVLQVTFKYPEGFNRKVFDFSKHLKKNALKTRKKEDTKIQIKAVSTDRKTGKKITAIAGDEDGAVRVLNYIGKSKSELQDLADNELENWKYDGLEGTLTGFGYPVVLAGDHLELIPTSDFIEQSGVFAVQKSTVNFGLQGYSRVLHLGFQIKE